MTIGAYVDVDNTLWNFSERFLVQLGIVPTHDLINRWVLSHDFGLTKDAFYELIFQTHLDQINFPPFPYSKEFLKELQILNLPITIISHRKSEGFNILEKWLNKYDLVYDKIICTKRPKSDYFSHDINLLFDDSPKIFMEKTNKRVIKFCVSYNYNKDVKVDYREERVVDFLPIVKQHLL